MKFATKILLIILSLNIFCLEMVAGNSLKGVKMLMIVYRFPRISEGFILNQIKFLLDNGVELDIIARQGDETDVTQKIVIDYNLMSKVRYLNFKKEVNYPRLLKYFTQKDYDIIYCQYDTIALDIAPLICKLENKPLFIAAVRGGEMDKKFIKRRNDYLFCFEKIDYFLPVSYFLQSKLIEFGCSSKKITVQHSAIDLKLFPFKYRKLIKDLPINIVTVARLNLSKGIQYAIEAISKIHTIYPDLTYTIVGGGPDEHKLRNIIANHNAEDYIKLVGWKTREEIAVIHDHIADIVLLPSIGHEGIPNALMEAMASGIPVISTYLNGIPELVEHGTRGLLADVGNADQLAEHIIYMIEHPEVVEQFVKNARDYVVKEHGTKYQNKKLLSLFCKMLKKHRLNKNKKNLDKNRNNAYC